jgi:uncharacterized protein (TIGR00251 family)
MINAARGTQNNPGRGDHPLVRDEIRVPIRVRPGAPVTRVGGAYGDALVVRVTAPALDGRATAAALRALAKAFGVPTAAVTLVTGATSRDKVVAIAGDPEVLQARAAALRAE